MKTNKICFLFTIIILSFLFSGCQFPSTEKPAPEEYILLAESYYEEKYNTDIDIIESSYNYYLIDVKEYSENSMFFKTSDNNIIYYDKYLDCFSDTKQTKEIYNKISTALLPQLTEYIKNPFYWDYDITSFRCNTTLIADEYDYSVFHNYYDEEKWVNFFATEKPSIYFDNSLYIVSNETTKYDEIAEYIQALFSQYMDISNLQIIFLNEELFNQGISYEIEGEEGFYKSITLLGYSSYSVTQNYVQLADGIYITCLNPDTEFTKDDFVVSKQMPIKDMMSVYKDALEKNYGPFKTSDYSSYSDVLFQENGYAYQIDFSDSYKERIEFSDVTWPHICIKIVPSELGSNLDTFYFFANYEDDDPRFNKTMLNGEYTTTYLYISYTENTDIYFGFGKQPDLDVSTYFQ